MQRAQRNFTPLRISQSKKVFSILRPWPQFVLEKNIVVTQQTPDIKQQTANNTSHETAQDNKAVNANKNILSFERKLTQKKVKYLI